MLVWVSGGALNGKADGGQEGGGEMGRAFILVLIHGLPEAPPFPLIIPASNAAPVARHGSWLLTSDRNLVVKAGPKQPNNTVIIIFKFAAAQKH
jgi:hypothetical protein